MSLFAVLAVIAVGLVIGLLVITPQQRDPVVIVVSLVAALAVAYGFSSIPPMLRQWRQDIREGRYERWNAQHERFRRWTWPLTVGAIAGALVASIDTSFQDDDFRWLVIPLGALAGILIASLVEMIAFGSGPAGARRLAWFYAESRAGATFMLVVAVGLGLLGLRQGPGAALFFGAFGALFVPLIRWTLAWVLEPLDGGRDLLPRRWFGAARRLDVTLESHVVDRVIRGEIALSPSAPAVSLRAEVIGTFKASIRVPEGPNGDRSDATERLVAWSWTASGPLAAEPIPFEAVLPDLAPTLDAPDVSVEWLLRVTAVARRRLDSVTDLRLVIVEPFLPVSRALAGPATGVRLDVDGVRAGASIHGIVAPADAAASVDLVRSIDILAGLGTESREVVATAAVDRETDRFEMPVPPTMPPTALVEGVASIRYEVKARDWPTVPVRVASRWAVGDLIPGAEQQRPPMAQRLAHSALLVLLIVGSGVFYAVVDSGRDSPAPTFPSFTRPSLRPPILDPLATPFPMPSFKFPSFEVPSFDSSFEIPSFDPTLP